MRYLAHGAGQFEIHVSTAVVDDGVCIRVGDNGQGFDPDTVLARGAGRGLQNQRRRAAALGGKVQWDSCPQGTLFTLWLPLNASQLSVIDRHSRHCRK